MRQFHLPVEPWDKKQLLLHLLTHESPALTLVFCRTKKTVDNLTEYLMRKGIDAHAMHGDMYQAKRNKVIEPSPGRLVLFADGLRMDVAQQLAEAMTAAGSAAKPRHYAPKKGRAG